MESISNTNFMFAFVRGLDNKVSRPISNSNNKASNDLGQQSNNLLIQLLFSYVRCKKTQNKFIQTLTTQEV